MDIFPWTFEIILLSISLVHEGLNCDEVGDHAVENLWKICSILSHDCNLKFLLSTSRFLMPIHMYWTELYSSDGPMLTPNRLVLERENRNRSQLTGSSHSRLKAPTCGPGHRISKNLQTIFSRTLIDLNFYIKYFTSD